MKTIFLILLMLPLSAFAKLVKKDIGFQIQPQKIKQNIHYSVGFYKDGMPKQLKVLDVEGLSSKPNTVTAVFKSALIINKPIEEINLSQFDNKEVHAGMLDAEVLGDLPESESSWRMSMWISIKKVKFDYQAYLTSNFTKNDKINEYILAAEELDKELPTPDYYLVQYVENTNTGLEKLITLSKIIPYQGKVLVVSYQLSRIYKSFYEKYNFFNAVKKVFTNKLTNTIEKTKNFLGSK